MDLAIAQVTAALRDAKSSADLLVRDLASVARQARGSTAAHSALANMQFFDKLSQRLANVCGGLEIPVKLLANAPPSHSQKWPDIQRELRSMYTTADEHVLCDIHFGGLRADNFNQALGTLRASARSGELDMF